MQVTLNKHSAEGPKWVGRWKVRLPNEPNQIFRCPQPIFNENSELHHPGMSIQCTASAKNMRLVRDKTVGGAAGTSTLRETFLLEMGKVQQDNWQLSVQSSLSQFQAMGLGVCSIHNL